MTRDEDIQEAARKMIPKASVQYECATCGNYFPAKYLYLENNSWLCSNMACTRDLSMKVTLAVFLEKYGINHVVYEP